MYFKRTIEQTVIESIKHFPVTAITGPRQCGKSTLVKQILPNISSDALYLDL